MDQYIEDQDDFANDPEILEERRLQAEYEKFLLECKDKLIKNLVLEETAEEPDLHSAELFKMAGEITDMTILRSAGGPYPLTVFLSAYHWVHQGQKSRSEGEDHCLFGLVHLNKDYPLTYIYKETIREKIVNWFVKGYIDFKDSPKFSKQFHVVTKDKDKLAILLNNKPLEELIAFPDLHMEISGNQCLFRSSEKTLSEELVTEFEALAKLLCKVLH